MIVCTPSNLNEATILKPYCDAFLVGIKDYTVSFRNCFSFNEINELKALNKQIILRLDYLLFEDEVSSFSTLISSLKDNDFLYYVNDIGSLEILKEHGLISKTIYDPLTMITNKLDAKFYNDLGLNAFGLSLEIPYKDVLTMTDLNLFYQVFGYREMFSSKRKVVSLYLEEKKLESHLENMILVEQTRNDSYPIFEDKRGTFIYRSYIINYLEHINDFKYALIDSLLIDFDTYFKIVQNAYAYKNNIIDLNSLNSNVNHLNLHIEDGFKFKDSVYQKEEF